MNSTVKTIMFWVFILICLMLLWGVVSQGTRRGQRAGDLLLRTVDKVQQGWCRTPPSRARNCTAT